MKSTRSFLLCFGAIAIASAPAQAQGTRLWTQSSYADLQKGTSKDVAIRSDGQLQAAPKTTLLSTLATTYAWSLASDAEGNAYVGTGSVTGTPSALLKVGGDGKSIKIAEFKEMAVQALAAANDGTIYAATSPDGKVYRVAAKARAGNSPDDEQGSAKPDAVFDPAQTVEKPKYIWALALDVAAKTLYIATGAPAAIYKVSTAQPAAHAELFFKSDDQHIRSLALGRDGTLYAGSDGSGVIYRISREGKSFALYSAQKREITSLALDDAGILYAAGVGGKAASNLPPLPVQGNVSVTATITYLSPGSASAANANTLIPDGSDIYSIAPDGTPEKLISMRDDIVYALAVRNGKLLAATGNKGRIYSIDTTGDKAGEGSFTDLARLDANQAMAFAPAKDGLFIATSNTGKLWLIGDATAGDASYISDVFDAQAFSQWGKMEVRARDASAISFYARSGNVENPKGAWSEWSPVGAGSDWKSGAATTVPAARFAQWKAVFHSAGEGAKGGSREAPSIQAVSLNYLPKNVAPVVDEVVVQTGARVVAANLLANQNNTVSISFAAPPSNNLLSFQQDASSAPLVAQKEKTGITARWMAHDDNGDDLVFSLYYRGEGEANWQLLKDRITDRFYSFDSALLPDGGYTLRVVASDAPSHTASDALTGERASSHFVVDTTPPVLTGMAAAMQGAAIHATLDARDATSPIAHAEYSVDAGPWNYLEPAGKISDSPSEHYDFTAAIPPLPPDAAKPSDPSEHVLAVRVYDRYENMAAVKAVVK